MQTFSNGYKKAITFSYDDGVLQDERLVALFDKYNLKATFNLNPGLFDGIEEWEQKGVVVKRLLQNKVESLYLNHEVANHGFTHPVIPTLDIKQKQDQIELCKKTLEDVFHTPIEGMAYPFGQVDEEMIAIMKRCGIRYGRVSTSSHQFDLPEDVYRWQATCHHKDPNVFMYIDTFLQSERECPQVLYIWGHSYEFDMDNNWEHMEEICRRVSNHKNVWYCTNIDIIKELEKNANSIV